MQAPQAPAEALSLDPAPAAPAPRPTRPPPKAPRLEALDDVSSWEIRATAEGRPYYVCAELGVSSWLMPPCLQALDRKVRALQV